ncbi:MAG: triose-phosphate isomerase [Chloroflexi bacterium]|nr:triose-phosphate isomerase [Chloroflexota bacterium]
MRIPIIAGNWKMNTTVAEAESLVREMKPRLEAVAGVERVLCPPFVSLASVAALLRGSSVKLGAQNLYHEDKGAFTGEISPLMLAGLCQYVIVGHSERRKYFGEDNAAVNRKAQAARRAGLVPIVCVGETLAENEAGRTREVIVGQVQGSLAGLEGPLVVAYEPVWAIGTGRAATAAQANATIGLIRRTLAALFGAARAQELPIQYGGSVTGANIAEFIAQPEIDGALVGGASLRAGDFIAIVEQTARLKGVR